MKSNTKVHLAFAGLTTTLLTAPAGASTEQVLYSFPQSNSAPNGPLQKDTTGALYGVAYYMGEYRLNEKNGSWSVSVIDPSELSGAGLAEDPATGVLYGVNVFGGAYGDGSVYSLTKKHKGWIESVIHSFAISDGQYPQATLFRDKITGALYGTSFYGGTHNCGTVFQLVPSNGEWNFHTLYSFQDGDNGCTSVVQLRQGPKAGSFIGATFRYHSPTTVFEIKERHGVWSEAPIYTFYDDNWATDLDTDANGTVYGVTDSGGDYGEGMVFRLISVRKKWSFSILYSFTGGSDGMEPVGIQYDTRTGILYGTTAWGGTEGGGTVFQLVNSKGGWTKTVLHNFSGDSDGASPQSRPIVDRTTGILYGTTKYGGANDGGVVYAVQP